MSKYINLHNHTEASIADGLFGPKRWVDAIKERGFKGHAITDHGSMTNLIPFYHLMKKESLIPIMGVEFYYVDDTTDKTNDNRKASHLILLAKNFEGWQNLCRLSKLSYTDGFYYKPKIGLEWISKYSEGLICLSACQGGVLSNHVWNERKSGKQNNQLENRFRQFKSIFGDDFYVEFQSHHTLTTIEGEDALFDSQAMVNQAFYDRLRTLEGFKQIVTNDCHYIKPEHAHIQRKLKEISWNGGGNSAGVAADSATVTKDHFTDSLWLKNAKEVYESFRRNHEYLPKEFVAQGMINSIEILEKCKDFEFPNKRYLPVFRPEIDSKELFKKLTSKLLLEFIKSDRMVATKEQYVARYKEEYRVISTYGLEDYFLIVWDLVRYAKKNGIYTGLGRGSAAGCFISYLLGIVQIDPLEYGLIFERFLNENRCVSGELPDIDLDFESDRRKEIKDYIFKTYGRDKVCEIGTYGRMKLKTALIDFGKALGVTTQKEILKITTSLDLDKEDVDSLIAATKASPQLQSLLDKNKDYSFFVTEIIGQIKSQGIHPAGVIICSEKLEDITPLKTQNRTLKPEEAELDGEKSERIITTQAEDKYIIASGMMKADVLGLKEYDVIKFVINNVPEIGMDVDDYVQKIMAQEKLKPNKKVWRMFQEGKTEGVFQFASQGMKDLLIMMQPDCINDLIAANALYRPGCLENGWHILYCDRKRGMEEIEYIHPDVEAALGTTFGVIVFQEQFMEVIHKLGGISLVDSDTIRSALGKKDKAKLDRFRIQFVEGASKKIDKNKAMELWRQIEKAAGYTFNRCVVGKTKFYGRKGKSESLTVEQMYLAMNDPEWSSLNHKKSIRKKFRSLGYGQAWSLCDDMRLRPNTIVDIRDEGVKPVFKVTTESGAEIVVTANHRFPTPSGHKMLMEMSIGDHLCVVDGWEKIDTSYRFNGESNIPQKGERGFQVKGDTSQKLFVSRSQELKSRHNHCQSCNELMKRKEVHHIDGNHGNQEWSNLTVVCPSCHKKAHYKMGRTKRGERGLLTRWERIIGVEYMGEEKVYDVEMFAPNHTFAVESGIVTCNSHSAAYSVLAYISQYFKVHYPAYFWAAQLDWDTRKNKLEDMLTNRRAATDAGIEYILPHINKSKMRFTVQDNKVVWSFSSIKGIGFKAAQELQAKQPFKDFDDFHKRINKSKVKYNNIQALIYSGAFDDFGDRRELLKISAAKTKGKKYVSPTEEDLLRRFAESMGFFERKIKDLRGTFTPSTMTEQDVITCDAGDTVRVGGMVTEIKTIKTKNGDNMGFVTLLDLDEQLSLTLFPRQWEDFRDLLDVGSIVEVVGVKSGYKNQQNCIEIDEVYSR